MKSEEHSILYPYTEDNIHPGFSVDCVLLAFHKKKLRVLLVKRGESHFWHLPGGFMMRTENAEESATRILEEYTNLRGVYLRQFQLFSNVDRTNREQNRLLVEQDKSKSLNDQSNDWFLQRFVSLGFYAFVKYTDVELNFAKNYETKWADVRALPLLYADHNQIIKSALRHIKLLIPILPIATELMPEKFKMSDLRKVFEVIGDKMLDRRNFQKKIIGSGLVEQLNEVADGVSYNPANLYTLSRNSKEHIFDLSKLLK